MATGVTADERASLASMRRGDDDLSQARLSRLDLEAQEATGPTTPSFSGDLTTTAGRSEHLRRINLLASGRELDSTQMSALMVDDLKLNSPGSTVTNFFDKGRDRDSGNRARTLIDSRHNSWPYFPAPGASGKLIPGWIQPNTKTFDRDSFGDALGARNTLATVLKFFGPGGQALGQHYLNLFPETADPRTIQRTNQDVTLLSQDPRWKTSPAVNQFLADFCDGISLAMERNYPHVAIIAKTKYTGGRADKSMELQALIMLAIQHFILAGFRMVDKIPDCFYNLLEQTPAAEAFRLRNWMANITTALAFTAELSIADSIDLTSTKAQRGFRLALRTLYDQSCMPVHLLLLDFKVDFLTNEDFPLDIMGILQQLVDKETASRTRAATRAATRAPQGSIMATNSFKPGVLPDPASYAEFKELDKATQNAINTRDKEVGHRLSYRKDDRGVRIQQTLCTKCKKWVDNELFSTHNLQCGGHATRSPTTLRTASAKKAEERYPAASSSTRTITCYGCGGVGHKRSECPQRKSSAALLTHVAETLDRLADSMPQATVAATTAAPPPTVAAPTTPTPSRYNAYLAQSRSAGQQATRSGSLQAMSTLLSTVSNANAARHGTTLVTSVLEPLSSVEESQAGGGEDDNACYYDYSSGIDDIEDPGIMLELPDMKLVQSWGTSVGGDIMCSHDKPPAMPINQALASTAIDPFSSVVRMHQEGIDGTRLRANAYAPEMVMATASRIAAELEYVVPSEWQNLETARMACGVDPFMRKEDVDSFINTYGLSPDSCTNLTCTSQISHLTDTRAQTTWIGTVAGQASVASTTAGSLRVQAISADGSEGIPLPRVDTVHTPQSSHNVFNLEQWMKDFSEVDGCLLPSREQKAQGVVPFMSIEGRKLLMAQWRGLRYIFVIPVECAINSHAANYSTLLTSMSCSEGAPPLAQTALLTPQTDLDFSTIGIEGIDEPLLEQYHIDGLGFTLCAEGIDNFYGASDEQHAYLNTVTQAVADYNSTLATTRRQAARASMPPEPEPPPVERDTPAAADVSTDASLGYDVSDHELETFAADLSAISPARPGDRPVREPDTQSLEPDTDPHNPVYGIYEIYDPDPPPPMPEVKKSLTRSPLTLLEWHHRLGHSSHRTIRGTLAKHGLRAKDDDGSTQLFCECCAVANAEKRHRGGRLGMQRPEEIRVPGELIAIDVFMLDITESMTGHRRLLLWMCVKSKFVGVQPYTLTPRTQGKYSLTYALVEVINTIRRLTHSERPIIIHSDAARDEVNSFSEETLAAIGGHQVTGAPWHSNTNPYAEAYIRIIRYRARAWMVGGGFPPQFGYVLILHAVEVQNDLISDDGTSARMRITGDKTPNPGVFDAVPGEICFAYSPTPSRHSATKMGARGRVCIYVGRGSICKAVGFLLYDPVARRLFVSPSVRFASTPFEQRRFPFVEGLLQEVVKIASSSLRQPRRAADPLDALLPNDMYAHELVDRKLVRYVNDEMQVGEIEDVRYQGGDHGDDLLFEVHWTNGVRTTREWMPFINIAHLLEDDSGAESRMLSGGESAIINLALSSPETASQIMDEATSCGTFRFEATTVMATSKAKAKKWGVGRRDEFTWTDLKYALRDAETPEMYEGWINAEVDERNKMDKFEVFGWTRILPGEENTVRTLKQPCKLKMLGDTHSVQQTKPKVRMVAGDGKNKLERMGCMPEGGWDSYAGTMAHHDFFLMIALSVQMGMLIWSLDAISAYLHADAPRERMLFYPPKGWKIPDPSNPILVARKAIYGDPESGAQYYKFFIGVLTKLQFIPVDRTKTWFYRKTSKGLIFMGTIVDDCVVSTSSEEVWLGLLQEIRAYVEVDAGPFTLFIGIQAHYDHAKGVMRLHQEHLARLAMTRFGINEDVKKRVSTPMETDFQGVPYDGVAKAEDVQRMQSILGTLQYLSLTRRTIQQCVNKLAKYSKNPSPSQLKAAERVLLYVVTTKDVPLVYSRTPWYTPDGAMMPSNKIVVWVDASFADSAPVDKCKSRTGIVIMLAGAAFITKSSLQSLVATSSCHAEVIALYDASVELMAVLQRLEKLGQEYSDVVDFMEDSTAAISVMSAGSGGPNSRHFLVKLFYTAELVEQGIIRLVKTPTAFQLADGFTKPLPRESYELHRHYIQGLHALSKEELNTIGLPFYDSNKPSS